MINSIAAVTISPQASKAASGSRRSSQIPHSGSAAGPGTWTRSGGHAHDSLGAARDLSTRCLLFGYDYPHRRHPWPDARVTRRGGCQGGIGHRTTRLTGREIVGAYHG